MKKKIMIISRALSHGGAERVATNLATYLSKYYEVLLVVIDGSRNTYGTTVETIDLGLSINNKGFRINWYMKFIREINNIKKERQITHAISFLSESDLVNVLTKKNSKAIISIRNKQSALVKGRIKKIRDKILFSKANSIVTLSEMVKYDLIKNYDVNEDKLKVIYNACNKKAIKDNMSQDIFTEKEKEIFSSSDNIIITAGRLSNQKGQWHLIRSFSKIIEKIPDAKLVILGTGEKELYLRELIRELKLEQSVFLLGYKSNPYPYLNKSKLFVFSSLFEGLGNILLEAMACEIPIISTDCDSGPRELLNPNSDIEDTGNTQNIIYGEYGILTPVFDGVEYKSSEPLTKEEMIYSEAVIKILKNKSLLLNYKKQSMKRGDDFSVDKIVQQWIDLIEY
ncbi:glycosyltransferase [Romboutsia sedimentorum]|uniref:glycosyltransferase n=1 Tax=Romboutsia sedimentorum TaxID=1368474 RepID=UPI0024DE7B5F|nr:glycosyltransferase [Romboutsia sedimentorum]MDK2586344.1 glycosyltransferase [Romboutsia sedimentorum]